MLAKASFKVEAVAKEVENTGEGYTSLRMVRGVIVPDEPIGMDRMLGFDAVQAQLSPAK